MALRWQDGILASENMMKNTTINVEEINDVCGHSEDGITMG